MRKIVSRNIIKEFSITKYLPELGGGFLFLLILMTLTACTMPGSEGQVKVPIKPPATEKAQMVFVAYYDKPLQEGESLEFVIIDEVTGIPFNQTRFQMTPTGENLYSALFSSAIGSTINYRYEKVSNGSRFIEHNYLSEPVEKRIYVVQQPEKVYDQIASFDETSSQAAKNPGYITGKAVHAETGTPLSDILIYCEGLQTITDANGNFTIYPLFPAAYSKHDIFAYSPNGSYLPLQQPVNIEYGLSTPVELEMTPSLWKKVTFTVTAPEDTFDGAPIRIAGNLSQLGSTFQDLGGGITGDVHNMPLLIKNEQGRYTVSLNLPAGIDIRYKYTVGDGFWNAEHGIDQNFIVHQLIIPIDSDDVYIHDTVYSWKSSQTEPIWFQVTTPENTPPEEHIGIQFQLADWMPPLPMFKIEDGRWAFPILSPHNFSGAISYRYCRNGPCTGVYQPGVESLSTLRESTTQFSETQLISDSIEAWATLSGEAETVDNDILPQARDADFLAGISYSPYYALTSQPFMEDSIHKISDYANFAVFSPAWAAQEPNLPMLFSPSKTNTPSWYETIEELELANDLELHTGVFPQIFYEGGAQAWWQAADTDSQAWWEQWIDQYRQFIYQHADLAQTTEADALIIGGEWVFYAMPIADNYATYSQPGNIEQIWQDTIEEIRSHFGGVIVLQIPIESVSDFPTSILNSVDQLYLQWDIPLDNEESSNPLSIQVGTKLDDAIESIEMPVVVVLAYPSAEGFSNYCIPSRVEPDTCLDPIPLLYGPSENIQAVTNLDAQTQLYMAALQAIDARPSIQGIVSQGYYPAIALHDASASIHGKPAEELISTWYSQFLGK